MKHEYKKIALSVLVLLAAGVSPNMFVAAQAGYANMSDLAVRYLIPAIVLIFIIITASNFIGLKDLSRQILNGIIAGAIATIGLEIVREIGFHLRRMPKNMPKLLNVLLLNRFALSPNTLSNIAE